MLAEDLAAALGGGAGAVDGAVDDALVDVVVDEPAAPARDADPAPLTTPSMHVLVEPVGGPGDRALDAADDDVGVEPVEVVLVHEHRVAGAGDPVALGDAVGPEAPEVPEVGEADADERR